jgi:hypothetical protein
MDPDLDSASYTAFFVLDLQDANKKVFCLLLFEGTHTDPTDPDPDPQHWSQLHEDQGQAAY